MRDSRLLAFVRGLVNQKLLLHNEYLAAENRMSRSRLNPESHSFILNDFPVFNCNVMALKSRNFG